MKRHDISISWLGYNMNPESDFKRMTVIVTECWSMVWFTRLFALLDYCNSLLYHLPDTLLCKLQSVQNATVWLTKDTWCRKHITQVLYISCTGYQSGSGLSSRSRALSTNCCLTRHLPKSIITSWSSVMMFCYITLQNTRSWLVLHASRDMYK